MVDVFHFYMFLLHTYARLLNQETYAHIYHLKTSLSSTWCTNSENEEETTDFDKELITALKGIELNSVGNATHSSREKLQSFKLQILLAGVPRRMVELLSRASSCGSILSDTRGALWVANFSNSSKQI